MVVDVVVVVVVNVVVVVVVDVVVVLVVDVNQDSLASACMLRAAIYSSVMGSGSKSTGFFRKVYVWSYKADSISIHKGSVWVYGTVM